MKLCLLILFAVFVFPTFAQSQKGKIYLKNGNVLNGKYIFSNDLQKIQIKSGGNTWLFNANEIDSISHVKIKSNEFKDLEYSQAPFYFRTELGLLIGNSDNNQSAPLSLSGSLNSNITSNVSVGGGLGLEFLSETYLPVFARAEYKLRDSYSTPYLFVKVGYQIAIEDSRTVHNYNPQPWSSFAPWPNYNSENLETEGGILVNSGIGYQRMYSANFGVSFAFGYQFHRLNYSGEENYDLDIDYNRLTIKLGIIFN